MHRPLAEEQLPGDLLAGQAHRARRQYLLVPGGQASETAQINWRTSVAHHLTEDSPPDPV